jgi:hypothetical protein
VALPVFVSTIEIHDCEFSDCVATTWRPSAHHELREKLMAEVAGTGVMAPDWRSATAKCKPPDWKVKTMRLVSTGFQRGSAA